MMGLFICCRYTVVFSLGSFLENRMLTIPCCEHLLEVRPGIHWLNSSNYIQWHMLEWGIA